MLLGLQGYMLNTFMLRDDFFFASLGSFNDSSHMHLRAGYNLCERYSAENFVLLKTF